MFFEVVVRIRCPVKLDLTVFVGKMQHAKFKKNEFLNWP